MVLLQVGRVQTLQAGKLEICCTLEKQLIKPFL